jgi:hypothetical protein
MALKSFRFLSLMLYALVLGVFWGTWLSQSRTMDALSAATFLENGRQYIANLAMPMRFLMPASLAATFAAAWFARRKGPAALWPALAAGILMAAALAVTLIVNVPIDNQIKTWTLESMPADWGRIRDHWEAFHALRTGMALAGFACLAGGSLNGGDRAAGA